MNEKEVKELLKIKGKTWGEFLEFMQGQTVGFEGDVIDYYKWDVLRFTGDTR